jgi:hypothetical protein
MNSVADLLEVHAASVFKVKVYSVDVFLCTQNTAHIHKCKHSKADITSTPNHSESPKISHDIYLVNISG